SVLDDGARDPALAEAFVERLVAVLLQRPLRRLDRRLRRLLQHLAAVRERVAPDRLRLLDEVVADRPDGPALVLRHRHEQSGEEPDREPAQDEPERVLRDESRAPPRDVAFRRAERAAHRLLERPGGSAGGVLRAAGRVFHAVRDVADRAAHGLQLLARSVLGARRNVRLVREGFDGVAQAGAGLFYLAPDFARVFAHSMSSFSVCAVCSSGGAVCWMVFFALCAATSATIP